MSARDAYLAELRAEMARIQRLIDAIEGETTRPAMNPSWPTSFCVVDYLKGVAPRAVGPAEVRVALEERGRPLQYMSVAQSLNRLVQRRQVVRVGRGMYGLAPQASA